MSLNNPKPGFNFASEFSVSGLPWVISDTATNVATQHKFDKIAKKIVIKNLEAAGTKLRVGFTDAGVNAVADNYYFVVDGGDTFEFEARIKEVYILRDAAADAEYSLYAELTTIDSNMMPSLSNWNGVG